MNKKTQSGFAYLVIIIVILAVAVVGLLGYVFWQNFMQPKTTTTTQTAKTTDKKSTYSPKTDEPTVVEDKNTLKIIQWGIKGIYNGTHSISYSISDSTIYFISKDSECSDGSVGRFIRYSGDDMVYPEYSESQVKASVLFAKDATFNKHIGDYYYRFVPPQNSCGPIFNEISNNFHNFFGTLTAI